jgi:hypothetical protein
MLHGSFIDQKRSYQSIFILRLYFQ